MLKNSESHYGTISKTLHWVVAMTVFAMFGVGFWMVDLTYYSDWYQVAPHYHKSVGILLAVLMVFRLVWRITSKKPAALDSHKRWETILAHTIHVLFYWILFAIFVSGYMISTADGRGIEVFNWFEVPSIGELFDKQEDVAGDVHKWLAYGLMGLVALHLAGALKHHFIDKDSTLKRMLK